MTNLNSILKSRDITLPTKAHLVKAMAFPVVMYECESWTIKKAGCHRVDALKLWCWRRLLRVFWIARSSNESILKEIRTDTAAEAPIFWPPEAKSQLIGKDWRQEEKGTKENEMVGWHHYGHEFEQALGVGEGQGSLVCCRPWGCKGSDRTEGLNWTNDKYQVPERDWILTVFWTGLRNYFLV